MFVSILNKTLFNAKTKPREHIAIRHAGVFRVFYFPRDFATGANARCEFKGQQVWNLAARFDGYFRFPATDGERLPALIQREEEHQNAEHYIDAPGWLARGVRRYERTVINL